VNVHRIRVEIIVPVEEFSTVEAVVKAVDGGLQDRMYGGLRAVFLLRGGTDEFMSDEQWERMEATRSGKSLRGWNFRRRKK
jgi:hypothetical protein